MSLPQRVHGLKETCQDMLEDSNSGTERKAEEHCINEDKQRRV